MMHLLPLIECVQPPPPPPLCTLTHRPQCTPQNPVATGNRTLASRVSRSVQEYMNNLNSWYVDYGKAYAKMMSLCE